MQKATGRDDLTALADMTLGQTLERAAGSWPNATAIVWRDRRLTYVELADRCRRFAAGLVGWGVQRGATLGQLCSKRPEVIESFLGTAMAAGRVVPLCPKFRYEDLRELTGLTEVRVLVADAEHIELARQLAADIGDVRVIVVGGAAARSHEIGYETLVNADPKPIRPAPEPDDVVYLNCTSGSTGLPKVCPTSHRVVQWGTIASISTLGVTGRDTYMGAFAVYSHPHELFIRSVPVGGAMILDEGVRPRRWVEVLREHRVRAAMGVPSFWRLVASVVQETGVELPDLWLAESGGGAASAGLIDDVHRALGRHLTPVWGSTETCGIALATPVGAAPRPGVLGKPVRYYQVDVVDEDRNVSPTGEVGEMRISGPGVCSGYLDAAETAEVFDGQCFCTGDLVRIDAHGFVHFVGRRKNMLKLGGLRVYPEKIEHVLEAHEGIAEAAVVPIADERHGQIPVAFVAPHPGVRLTHQDVVHICREHLAEFEAPRRTRFVDRLPKLGNGKVDRRALIEQADPNASISPT